MIDQKRCLQGAVHDQTGITFRLCGVVPVIMDAMGVEGEGGIAKEERCAGINCAARLGLSPFAWRRRSAWPGAISKDNVEVFGERKRLADKILMANSEEGERSAAP